MTVLGDIKHPIVQAPMAGGPSTPALAAAVSLAGGLGFLASGYRDAGDTAEAIGDVRRRTSAPFGVNVFVPGDAAVNHEAIDDYVEQLRYESERYGVPVGEPRFEDDDFEAKVDLLRQARIPVVSFTFGCPSAEVLSALKVAGSEIWVTATTPAEARLAVDAGADVLVLQGVEAGGHRGAFVDDDRAEGFGILALLRLVATEVDLPLVAAGGIADGAAIAAALTAGAAAAQVGTSFMLADEAGTHSAHRGELASERPTALTRAFSGRQARGIVNRFLQEHSSGAPRGYPHLHHATAPLRAAAREQGDGEGFNLWAGQAHRLARAGPAAHILQRLASDAERALVTASQRFVPSNR